MRRRKNSLDRVWLDVELLVWLASVPVGLLHYLDPDLPNWLLFGLYAATVIAFFALRFRNWRRERRARALREAGRCQCCGYDLRGLTSETCPECSNSVDWYSKLKASRPPSH